MSTISNRFVCLKQEGGRPLFTLLSLSSWAQSLSRQRPLEFCLTENKIVLSQWSLCFYPFFSDHFNINC